MKKLILVLIVIMGYTCAGASSIDGLHPFGKNGKWGFMNESGKVVIPPAYDGCRDFHNGYAAVMIGGSWGMIDASGRLVIAAEFDSIDDFSDGYAYAVKDSVSYYVTDGGHEQRLKKGYSYGRFSEGLAPVYDEGRHKWGYINAKGKIVIDPVYDTVTDFSNKVALVIYKGKQQYIRPSGMRTKKGAGDFIASPVYDAIVYSGVGQADSGDVNLSEDATYTETHVPVEVVRNDVGESGLSELLQNIHMVAEQDPNKYALIIGNEDYNTFKQDAVYEQNVDYAIADAEMFKEYAVRYMGVPDSNVILLRNAPKYLMNRNLNKLVSQASSNPGHRELYVFYAGHGVHDDKTRYTYLLPVDVSSNTPEDGLKLDDVYEKLASSQAKRVMVFMDACYSGKGRGIVIRPREPVVKGNMLVFTATSSTQKSMPYEEKKHGIFTYFLLKAIRDNDGKISVSDLYNTVKIDVESNSTWINDSKQSPELLHGQDIESGWEEWTLD